jgi:hypothetical protein
VVSANMCESMDLTTDALAAVLWLGEAGVA